MKTRQEMIYDFMLALASDYGKASEEVEFQGEYDSFAVGIVEFAKVLADTYLENIG
jgi:hypothetical protein